MIDKKNNEDKHDEKINIVLPIYLLLFGRIVLPTIMSTLIVIVYLEELDKITFIDNTLMKIAFVVSVLHLIIMLGIVITSIINDIKEIRKARFYLKHPEERKRQAKST